MVSFFSKNYLQKTCNVPIEEYLHFSNLLIEYLYSWLCFAFGFVFFCFFAYLLGCVFSLAFHVIKMLDMYKIHQSVNKTGHV